jgi:hypothetical protein
VDVTDEELIDIVEAFQEDEGKEESDKNKMANGFPI